MKTLIPCFLVISLLVCGIKQTRAQSYTIPVVFHVLHQGGSENIPDSSIVNALRVLNDDYNKRNADTIDVSPYYQNNVADVGVTFRLANIDPNGNYTNGIDRIYSSLTNMGNETAKLNQWDPARYLNIWVVANLQDGIAAYAYSPWAALTKPESDGLIILSSYINLDGSGVTRALTHELGHYLCLLHLSSNCLGTDSVADTPPTRAPSGFCADSLSIFDCTQGILGNYENFMGFAPCASMFTNGQKDRVHMCLDNYRDSLAMPSNLVATGTDYANPFPSPPVADFSVNKRLVCLGTPVTFSDASYNGAVDTRNWTFQNANISTSTDENPVVTFTTLGWQEVTLNVTNTVASSSKTRTLVYVADANAQLTVPYYNSFNDTADFASNWITMNIDDDQASFMPLGNGAFTNSMAIVLTNFNSTVEGSYDELITPAFDLRGVTAPDDSLSFVYSYASQEFVPPGPVDSLAVFATANCGTTWTNIFKKAGDALMNGGYVTSSFLPNNAAYWSQVNVPIPFAFKTDHVRFKLKIWGSRISNNFYLDDFTVGKVFNGIAENKLPVLSVIPNPFNSQIRINRLSEGSYTIAVFDITGREVKSFANMNATGNYINLDLSSVTTKGIYVLKLTNSSGQSRALKLVRE